MASNISKMQLQLYLKKGDLIVSKLKVEIFVSWVRFAEQYQLAWNV